MPITVNERTILSNKIKNLTEKHDLIDLYKLIKQHNIPYNKNSNGIFIDLMVIDDNNFRKLSEFIDNLGKEKETKKIMPTFVPDQNDPHYNKLSTTEKSILKKQKYYRYSVTESDTDVIYSDFNI